MQNFDQCPSMCAFKKTGKSENYFEENPQRNAPSHVDGPNWLGLLQVDRCSEQKYSGWISLNKSWCGQFQNCWKSQKWFCQASVSKLLKILKVKSDFVRLPSRTGEAASKKSAGMDSTPFLPTLSFISGPWRREKSKQNEPISLPDDPQSKCFRKKDSSSIFILEILGFKDVLVCGGSEGTSMEGDTNNNVDNDGDAYDADDEVNYTDDDYFCLAIMMIML